MEGGGRSCIALHGTHALNFEEGEGEGEMDGPIGRWIDGWFNKGECGKGKGKGLPTYSRLS